MRYDAFLSYSHAEDADLAASIQSSLQRFARPWYKTQALRVFRDKTGLSANPDLWDSIVAALQASDYLLLLASPQAAASHWVNQEVEWFLRHKTPEKILIVITAGQVAWSGTASEFDWTQTTALPKALGGAFRMEPLYVDLSWAHQAQLQHDARFRDAILDLAAPLHGRAKDELDSEDLRQHRRTMRIAWSAVALLSVLAVALGIAAIYATQERNVARQETKTATAETSRAVQQEQIAHQQRQLAEDRRAIALSRQLAAQAVGDAANQLDAAMLEAVESFRAAPTFEARQALLSVLFYSPHLRQFLGGGRRVWSTATMSRDGRILAALDQDSGNVAIEVAGDKALETMGEVSGGGKVKAVAMSADGRRFATGEAGKVVLRNTRTRAVEATLTDGLTSGGAPSVMTFSRDGSQIAAYETSAGVLIWDAATRRMHAQPLRPKRWENVLAFSPDGAMLASGAHDGSIVLWSAATGQPIGAPLVGHHMQIFGLAFSPDGKILASGSEDRTIILWNAKTGQPLGPPLSGHGKWPLGNDPWGLSVAFSPDGKTLVSAAKDRNLILWDVASRKAIGNPLRGHGAPPMAVAFSADGRSLLSLGRDNVALRWSGDSLGVLGRRLGSDGDGASSIAFSPDSKLLAAATMDNGVILWDSERAQPAGRPLRGQASQILSLSFLPDGGKLLSGSKDGVVAWDVKGGKSIKSKLSGTEDSVSQVAFSPDGNSTAWSDGSVLLVRTGAKAPIHMPVALASPDHSVMSLAFSPDSRLLASGGEDGTVALWDISTRKLVWPAAKAHRLPVQTLAFSPDGKILVSAAIGTADFDGMVRLWDTQSGKELPPALAGHSEPVRALAFSTDGKMLASGVGERIVFWDVERRQSLGEAAMDNSGFVTALSFSADARWLGSSAFSDNAVVWDLRPETWLHQVCAVANRNLDEAEWKRLIGDTPPYRQTCQ